jgi:hypothetical protein
VNKRGQINLYLHREMKVVHDAQRRFQSDARVNLDIVAWYKHTSRRAAEDAMRVCFTFTPIPRHHALSRRIFPPRALTYRFEVHATRPCSLSSARVEGLLQSFRSFSASMTIPQFQASVHRTWATAATNRQEHVVLTPQQLSSEFSIYRWKTTWRPWGSRCPDIIRLSLQILHLLRLLLFHLSTLS